MRTRRATRGFTLIELMVSAGIIGILASIAIPVAQRSVLRAKVAERRPTMMQIAQSLQDFQTRNGGLVLVPGGGVLDSGFNPPLPPVPGKRPMQWTPVWNTYSTGPAAIEGGVYYSYRFLIEDTPALGRVTIWAASDLDADGVISYKQLVFIRGTGDAFRLSSEFPLQGQEDDSGPYATF